MTEIQEFSFDGNFLTELHFGWCERVNDDRRRANCDCAEERNALLIAFRNSQ